MRTARKFRPDIEGLRAVAVLLVVLYHAGVPGITGGYVGVDVFFVISGFLITTHLLGELTTTGKISLKNFYARRVRRLLPTACVVTIAITIMAVLWQNPVDARNSAVDGLWTTFFSLNIRLAQESVDYLNNAAPSPFQHYWSLAVEEQFYLLWPALVIGLSLWWARRTDRSGQPWLLTAGLIALVAGSLTWGVIETTVNQPYAYFLIPSRAWELGAGALIALGARYFVRIPDLVGGALSVMGLIVILFSSFIYTDATTFPGLAATLPAVGTTMVLAGGLHKATGAEYVLQFKPFQAIGKVSYGWYLWHWPLLVMLPIYLGHSATLTQNLAIVLLGLWLASASFISYEAPLRFLSSLRKPRRSFLMASAFVATAVVVTLTVPLVASSPDLMGSGVAQADTTAESQSELTVAIKSSESLTAVPSNLTPSPIDTKQDLPVTPWVNGDSCMVAIPTTDVGGDCGVETTTGTVKVVLTGDSHAYQWAPALIPIAQRMHWDLTIIAKSGCPLYDVSIYNTKLKRDYTECYEWRASAMDRIKQLNPDLIITSAFIASAKGDGYAEEWAGGVTKTIDELTAIGGAPVAAISDTPWPVKDSPTCMLAHLTDIQACNLQRTQPVRDAVRSVQTPLAAAAAGAVVIDPTNWFCAAMCPVVIGNTPVYRDDTHITATMAAKLDPLLSAALPKPRGS